MDTTKNKDQHPVSGMVKTLAVSIDAVSRKVARTNRAAMSMNM